MDRSPAEVMATLLDEEVYLCSERTMYRVLASEVPVQERRAQRTHPEQEARVDGHGANQVWSWDITRLLGPGYVIMDIYSRRPGWSDRENLAGRLIQQSCLKHGVQPRLLFGSGSSNRANAPLNFC